MREVVQFQHAGAAYAWADGVLSARQGDAPPRFLVLPGFLEAARRAAGDPAFSRDLSSALAMIANGALDSGYQSEAAARQAARSASAVSRVVAALKDFALEQVEQLAAELEQLAQLEP